MTGPLSIQQRARVGAHVAASFAGLDQHVFASIAADTGLDLAPQIAPAEELQTEQPEAVSTRFGLILAAFVAGVIFHHVIWSSNL